MIGEDNYQILLSYVLLNVMRIRRIRFFPIPRVSTATL